MRRPLGLWSAALLLAAGLGFLAACGQPEGKILGQAPVGEPTSIAAIKTAGHAAPVTLHGVIIEKCPVAGCWFRLRDSTGTVKVDTKSAGFVVVKIPLESEITVSGKIVPEGDQWVIQANGVRY